MKCAVCETLKQTNKIPVEYTCKAVEEGKLSADGLFAKITINGIAIDCDEYIKRTQQEPKE